MNKVKYLNLALITIGMIFMTSCDLGKNNTQSLEESFELFTDLNPIAEASNTVLNVNRGSDIHSDGYFTITISNALPNKFVHNITTEAWCLEWNKPLRSNNDVHEGVKWHYTGGSDKWKPMNYFMGIKNDLRREDPDLTYREIQAVIWSIAGYMDLAPEYNVDKLSDEELTRTLRLNSISEFSRDKVREISEMVLSNYSAATVHFSGVVAQTDDDQQNVIGDPTDPDAEIARIEVEPDPVEVRATLTQQMEATVFDTDNNVISCENLIWTTADGSIATVDSNGLLTGVAEGETTVTASCGEISDSATVIVLPPPPVIDVDTNIFIYFDASGSMNSTLAPLQNMRDNLLKNALLPLYNNDGDAYDERVNVISWTNERTMQVLNLQGATPPDGNVIVLVFQDEAQSIYTSSSTLWNENTTRTSAFNTDIGLLRNRLEQFENDFGPNYYRGVIFQVEDRNSLGNFNQRGVNFKKLIEYVQNGIGNYAPPFGLSDRHEFNYVYDINDGDDPEVYLELVLDALRDLGFQI